jgi:hypothetical protein
MAEWGIPGTLNDRGGSGFDAFRSYFAGGWSLENPFATYYVQDTGERKRLAALTGAALRNDWELYVAKQTANQTSASLKDFLTQVSQTE